MNEDKKLNIRKMITRKVTYSIVTIKFNDSFWNNEYYVYGTTSVKTELKKLLKNESFPTDEIPQISIKQVTEKRVIDIDNFIKYSIKINE